MKIQNKTCTIILTQRETRTLTEGDSRDADELNGCVRQAAHDMASRIGLRSEVYATKRDGAYTARWLVYSCEP